MKIATRTILGVLLTVTSSLLFSGTLAGSETPPLERRRSMDFDKTEMSVALRILFAQSGLGYRVDGGPDHEFNRRLLSFCVDEVRLRVVLDSICDGVGCTWLQVGREIVFLPSLRPGSIGAVERDPAELERFLDQEIEVNLGDASAGEVFDALEVLTGAPITSSDELKAGRVNLSLNPRPTRAVLDALCEQLACSWRVETFDSRARIVLER